MANDENSGIPLNVFFRISLSKKPLSKRNPSSLSCHSDFFPLGIDPKRDSIEHNAETRAHVICKIGSRQTAVLLLVAKKQLSSTTTTTTTKLCLWLALATIFTHREGHLIVIHMSVSNTRRSSFIFSSRGIPSARNFRQTTRSRELPGDRRFPLPDDASFPHSSWSCWRTLPFYFWGTR